MDSRLNSKIEKRLSQLKKGELTTPKNCKTMLKFYNFCEAKGLSPARHVIFFDKLLLACRVIGNKEFEKWDRLDIEKLFAYMGKAKVCGRQGYSMWSLETEKGVLIGFFKWLYDTETTPKFLKWLKFKKVPNGLTKEQLLTPDDIERMILATQNTMYKALLATYTTSARPNEIHEIKIGDVIDEGDLIKIYVGGRAGKMSKKAGQRAVYIIKFTDYFRPWIQNHPQKGDKNAWVFVGKSGERIRYEFMARIINKVAKKAGIEKRVFPYLFRHSVGTYLYAKYGVVYGRRLMGHISGSKMEAVYTHLSQTDIEDVLRGEKPMNNGFNFGNVEEAKDLKAEFWKFINENKEGILKMYEKWISEKNNH